ncbi:MAG: spore coat associated protein CotJA [Ruminococcus sp.]|nr:spore coat associated protein CotJA [Ruminococcus sp.]MBQ1381669.1 spore coat associated protein CotJA [Ruminococcus sp.]MBQ1600948.1 spore coat associated protein CotJA [Ruminococcus sp.]MBQ1687568.1 spore coat associated protein CotJA [Ruminococcus sp.]MBQ1807210.1 spore coat associated protein CotJA [Ruminococcus sp.]
MELLPDTPVYAMAYVPFQSEKAKVFSPDQGFMLGTMYPALNKPFYGKKCGDADD